ncbi:MAG: bifunctional lysine ketoglutarate reductase /saccharopine dehydrogenase family protein [Bacteroidales bacterium]|jgi:alpha-aminoadipic semialdehyde synthase|nr:bifunctional lysine ketoglutarate reductase /saccharopine dehydrogenase family protein [Bacteroidales bacterium]
MKSIIGIRHEDKYLMERRVPLVPAHIKELIEKYGLRFEVQSSGKRVFSDKEFSEVGAGIVQDLSNAGVIFGVKEMPSTFFQENKTYIFFSHVIKGQSYNMPMLNAMIQNKCNLIDYERVANDKGQRLIFFGRYAGLAGMINTLWTLGLRLKYYGHDTPFLKIKQAYTYKSLDEARAAVSEVGRDIAAHGMTPMLSPFVFGITGYGNVSRGAMEILDLLPVKEITPQELVAAGANLTPDPFCVYKVVFKEEHISARNDESDFDLQHYYNNPGEYHSIFEQYIPHLSSLINGMYWDSRYPRIITRDQLMASYSVNRIPKLLVIGDITCDPDGSIEATVKGTYVEDPIYVYDPFNAEIVSGYETDGIQIMAVDILPSELPRESSEAFSSALYEYVDAIAECDFSKDFAELQLPMDIKRALILKQGKFTPDFEYIQDYL